MPISPVRPSVPHSTRAASVPGFRYSENVVKTVMDRFDVGDRTALLARAALLDEGNRYLKRSEMEAAARALTARAAETGVISDLDSTR